MKMSNTIKGAIAQENITLTELANRLGISVNNLSNKLKRDNFKLEELEQIATAISYELDIRLIKKSDSHMNVNIIGSSGAGISNFFSSDSTKAKMELLQTIDDYIEASLHEHVKSKLEEIINQNLDIYSTTENKRNHTGKK